MHAACGDVNVMKWPYGPLNALHRACINVELLIVEMAWVMIDLGPSSV